MRKQEMNKNYKELIKSFTKEDYESNVNLHIHSTFSDGDGNAETLVAQAKSIGLKYIAISDHNTLNAYLQTDILKEEMVIPAIEFDCWYGTVFLHMLGYGVDVNNKELQALCAKTKRGTEADWVRIFSFKHPKRVIKAIHDAGGLAVLAHPACCFTLSLDRLVNNLVKLGMDGIEVYYPYARHRRIVKFHTINTVEKLGSKYNLIKTGGTDEHGELG
ncbi:MAG: PHP domain-containing protein [Candidatus Gastranaerophilaceae bacterium]